MKPFELGGFCLVFITDYERDNYRAHRSLPLCFYLRSDVVVGELTDGLYTPECVVPIHSFLFFFFLFLEKYSLQLKYTIPMGT